MSTLEVWIIIILILGVIASNLAVLKYSAKFKLPQFGQHDKDKQLKPDSADPTAPDNTDDEADTPDPSTSATPTHEEDKTKHKA